MVSRSLKRASGAVALIALLGTSARAAEFNLASLAGMTCKGFFVGGSSEMATGGKTYYWELTPTGTSGEFLIKITGYTFGNEGKLECAR
jgi:hypothetical protein